ncbi:MAG: glycoside hydrolase family 5 protein [Methylococcaceae bacterium]|nr:glycoside hydrolase family 5 protein [Methylococcaceae bacterium]
MNTTDYPIKLRGVNLGGWLVLEKWMTPSLFSGLQAVDETTFCVELGNRAEQLLKEHWQTFITRDDFVWLAQKGINAVRIPVGHWLFGPPYPYHSAYGSLPHPYVQGGVDILDNAFKWADALGLHIVLDLHAAPGCQNGFDNGGIQGVCEWHTQDAYINHSLNILELLAERYHGRPSLHAIEVLNEPRWDIATPTLKKFTIEGYHRIRKHCRAEDVALVFHDGFRSYTEYSGFLSEPTYSNVIFDIHRYQCFVQTDLDMDIYGHIQKASIHWKNEADEINLNLGLSACVGEWSLGLHLHASTLFTKPMSNDDGKVLSPFHENLCYKAYAATQLLTFERYRGWFFWSYKTESAPAWSFRECVNRGWLPERFDADPIQC